MKITHTNMAALLQTMCAQILTNNCMRMTVNGLCNEFDNVAEHEHGITRFSFYPFMRYMIGDDYYCRGGEGRNMGAQRALSNKRKAFCTYIVSLNIRTLRRYIAAADKSIMYAFFPGVSCVVRMLDKTKN